MSMPRSRGAARPRHHFRADPTPRENLVGIAFMLLASLVLPAMNAGVKYLNDFYPSGQIVWARYAGHLLVMIVVFLPWHGTGLFRSQRPGIQLVRSLLLFVSTAFFVYALRYLELAVAMAIVFTTPIVVTALSVPFLSEKVGPRRWAAVAVGFAGALIIIQPGGAGFHWAMLLVVANMIMFSVYQILTRKIAADDTPETTITYTALVGAVAAGLFFLVEPGIWPVSALHWLLYFLLGVFGGFGQYFVIKAFQYSLASVVAPITYVQLVIAGLFGYLIFAEVPDRWTWIGSAVVVASGLYITYRERRRQVVRDEDASPVAPGAGPP
jgi:drug/metabolite transporter (DMT)-like permease